MKYRVFEQELTPFRVFSTDIIRKKAPDFDSRRLVEWQQKEYIHKIINRWYLFSDTVLTEQFLFLIANKIYAPSYISFETALSYYGLIPEGVYTVISATSRKTKNFQTPQGRFHYRKLKPECIFGYHLEAVENQHFKIADPEKAILDFLYLHPEIKNVTDFEAWRINTDWLVNELDSDKLGNYLSLFFNKALTRRVNALMKFIEHAKH